MDLVPEVTVVVHPIDLTQHPSYPPGWRWAVMVGGRPPTDLDFCVNAGHCMTEGEASLVGEQNGASATKALRLLGVPARYGFLRLDHDPIPAEADERPLAVWRGEDG
jgi:hypothetical protein